ncbi:MAG: SLBB domain-containing protein [Pseudomonadota bacterium]
MITSFRQGIVGLLLTSLFLMSGCASNEPAILETGMVKSNKVKNFVYATPDVLAGFEVPENAPFRIGTGDKVSMKSLTRDELTSTQVVGPDGKISVPLLGPIKLAAQTREEAEANINKALARFYKFPALQLTIDEYNSNRVIILGRVENPGVLKFENPPTLIEALARAGTLPLMDKQATLTRCAIFRGRNAIIWVDLKRVLVGGDLRGNIRLKPDDLIYIPDSDDTLVYVLGEVNKPGAYRLTPDMAFLDALAQAGGPTHEAAGSSMTLFRGSEAILQNIPFKPLVQRDPTLNVALQEGDVIYVPRSITSSVGAFFQQLAPAVGMFLLIDNAITK